MQETIDVILYWCRDVLLVLRALGGHAGGERTGIVLGNFGNDDLKMVDVVALYTRHQPSVMHT